jgi:LysR family glycine cleavage system transcriptional activator
MTFNNHTVLNKAFKTDLLSWDLLKAFWHVAHTLHFRKAAEALHITPAALTVRIRTLEEHLGYALFERNTRKVALSPAGQNILPQVEALLAQAHMLLAGDSPMTISETLRIGTRHELGMSWVMPHIQKLESLHPKLTVHIRMGTSSELIHLLHQRQLDAVITSSKVDHPDLILEHLHQESYVFVGHPLLLEKQPLRSKHDAQHHILIDGYESLPLFQYVSKTFNGFPAQHFKQIRTMGGIEAILWCIQHQMGVGVLPYYYVEKFLQQKKLKVIMPKMKLLDDAFHWVYHKQDSRSTLHQSIAQYLRQQPLR